MYNYKEVYSHTLLIKITNFVRIALGVVAEAALCFVGQPMNWSRRNRLNCQNSPHLTAMSIAAAGCANHASSTKIIF